MIVKLLEKTNCRPYVNDKISILAARKAARYDVKAALPGLKSVVDKELGIGGIDIGSWGQVLQSFALVAGQDAYETLRKKYDQSIENFVSYYAKHPEINPNFYDRNLCYIIRGLLVIPDIPTDIFDIAKRIFQFFAEMKLIKREDLSPLAALIWGTRKGRRKELLPDIENLMKKAQFEEREKNDWMEFLHESCEALRKL